MLSLCALKNVNVVEVKFRQINCDTIRKRACNSDAVKLLLFTEH